MIEKLSGTLCSIGDEDACNQITHYLEHEDKAVRLAACRGALKVNTDYMNTRVRYQLSRESDPEMKKKIQEAFNQARS